MEAIKRLYVRLCLRWGPTYKGQRVTFSAWAWARAQDTGDVWFRNRIDGAFLFFRSEHNHCQSRFQREVRDSNQ